VTEISLVALSHRGLHDLMAFPPGLLIAARFGKVDDLELLLDESGAAVDVRDANGSTLLMVCAFELQTAHVEALLARGADPNATDSEGGFALLNASLNACGMNPARAANDGTRQRAREVGMLLLAAGAKADAALPPDVPAYMMRPAQQWADAAHGKAARTTPLDEAWAECSEAFGATAVFAEAVLRWLQERSLATALAAHADERGVTLLHLAASLGSWQASAALLSHGADAAAANGAGATPLEDALEFGHEELAQLLLAAPRADAGLSPVEHAFDLRCAASVDAGALTAARADELTDSLAALGSDEAREVRMLELLGELDACGEEEEESEAEGDESEESDSESESEQEVGARRFGRI
jgi:ankyrin repeat protein